MPSTFESVAKSVIQELDPRGGLIPVDSLRNSTSFQPYSLLGRKLSSSWFWKPRYKCLNLSLRDILEPDAPEPAVERGTSIRFEDLMDGELQVNTALRALGQGKFAGGAAVSARVSTSMNVCTLQVPTNAWEAMNKERRLRQPEHKLLQQLRSCGNDVFVVTEVLQTQEEVEVTRAQKQEGSGQFTLPGALRVEGKGQGHLNQKKTVTIPSGSVLAFRAALLVIGPDWEIYLFPQKNQRTFRLLEKAHKPTSSIGLLSQIPLSYFKIRFPSTPEDLASDGDVEDQMPVTEDFQGLKVEVGIHAEGLNGLSRELCRQVLAGLVQVLQDEPALETLEEALEQGLCCGQVASLDAPGGAILECLVRPSGDVEEELARPILYLMQALTELSETQRGLLVEALETGDLSRQSRLVQSILEQSSPWKEHRAVSLPQELLGSSWDSKAPAWVLLKECGLELQADAPQVYWSPDARGRTCALHSSLALLSHLSRDSA